MHTTSFLFKYLFTEEVKQSDWDSVLCVHQSLRMVTTWDYTKSTMGKYKLDNDRFKQDETRFSNITATVKAIDHLFQPIDLFS